MDPRLVELRRAARLKEHELPARCELCGREDRDHQIHHVGGRKYGGLPVRVCVPCHKELTRRQGPYAHLLDLEATPVWVTEIIWRLDAAAIAELVAERGRLRDSLLERIAHAERERVREVVAPHLRSPEIRTMLRPKRNGSARS